MLGTRELVVRDETILVLILMLEDLLDQFIVLLQHILQLIRVLTLHSGHLFLQIFADLNRHTKQTNRHIIAITGHSNQDIMKNEVSNEPRPTDISHIECRTITK